MRPRQHPRPARKGALPSKRWQPDPAPLFRHALTQHLAGDVQGARAGYEAVLARDARHADALHLLGVIELESGQAAAAAQLISRSLAAHAGNAAAHSNLGNALRSLGRLDEAVASYDRALALDPGFAEAQVNRGNALKELCRFDEALEGFERAIAERPDLAEAHGSRGAALAALGRWDEALESYTRAIGLAPGYADAHFNRANALRALGRSEEAIAGYNHALAAVPHHAAAHVNRGLALVDLERLDEALSSFESAATAADDDADVHYNRANVLRLLGRLPEALAGYDRALALANDHAEAHNNRGQTLQALARMDEALRAYDRAIAHRADHAPAYCNKALALLSREAFAAGWPLYDWRWRTNDGRLHDYGLTLPLWDGAPLHGRLLLLSEQGLGDQIFYLGMLDDLAGRVGAVTVCLDPRLISLCCRSFPGIRFVANDPQSVQQEVSSCAQIEAQLYMGSLGRHLRKRREDFVSTRSGYLSACPEQSRTFRERLSDGAAQVCGLSWTSSNPALGVPKSLALADMVAALPMPGLRLVNLQYGNISAERRALETRHGVQLADVPEVDNFADIDGLASIIDACDFVVTVSNTTAHLAAALGKPVYVLLASGPGLFYYWHLERSDSPWYPTARLYRQDSPGHWRAALDCLREDLHRHAAALRCGTS